MVANKIHWAANCQIQTKPRSTLPTHPPTPQPLPADTTY